MQPALVRPFLDSHGAVTVVERRATSKVSYDQLRGLPAPFLVVQEYRGPCGENTACARSGVKSLRPAPMLLDAGVALLAAMALVEITWLFAIARKLSLS